MTVSYGTFSCTLEGFDDPFATMREMAEYFRDLAAGDRFFGAEPPQPDVDALHRIAEQTVQQQITSEHVSKDNLVLRQADAAAEPSASQPAPAQPAPTQPAPTQAAPTQPAQTQAAASPAPQSGAASPLAAAVVGMPAAAEILDSGNAGSVAEKLQRIRSVVASEAKPTTNYSEDEHASDFMARARQNVSRPVSRVVSEGYYDDMQDHKVATPSPAQPEMDQQQEDTAATLESQEETDFQEVERLASGVTLSADEDGFDDEEVLSLDADGNLEDGTRSLMDDGFTEAEIVEDAPLMERSPVEVDEVSQEELAAANTSPAQTTEGFSETFETESRPEEISAQEVQPEDTRPEEISAEEADQLQRDVAELNAAEQEQEPVQADEPAQEASPASKLPPVDTMMSGAFRDFREQFVNGEDPADQEFSFEDGSASPEEAETEPTETEAAPEEDVAEPQTLMAEPVSETAQDAVNEDVEVDVARAAKQARRDALTEDEDSALERLMNATSSRLEDTEGSVRRASIAHLKAAVAATKADSSLVESAAAKEAAELDQYREDLARVVRPGKSADAVADAKPVATQPSPLVLVSEQRIDEVSHEDVMNEVRPRRVSGAPHMSSVDASSVEATADGVADFEDDTNIFADTETESFEAYIQRHEATQLPDILEAAAAHYCFVEGVEQFTRPMLMRKISAISPEHELSREDGLRSFGTLLREGKIVKDEDGKFVIATTSRFMQESRYAGE